MLTDCWMGTFFTEEKSCLVDYVTVGKDKTMVFTLIGGTEMKA